MTAPNTDTPAVAWRSVPVEPTVEMRIAGVQAWRDDETDAPVTRIWEAMLAAAPAPDPTSLQKMQRTPDDLAMREAVAREICDAILDQEMDGRVELGDDLTIRYLDQGAVDFGQVADRVLSLLRSTVGTGG